MLIDQKGIVGAHLRVRPLGSTACPYTFGNERVVLYPRFCAEI